jgi:hypothetical protein
MIRVAIAENSHLGPHAVKLKCGVTSKYGGGHVLIA